MLVDFALFLLRWYMRRARIYRLDVWREPALGTTRYHDGYGREPDFVVLEP